MNVKFFSVTVSSSHRQQKHSLLRFTTIIAEVAPELS